MTESGAVITKAASSAPDAITSCVSVSRVEVPVD